ncbi:MAG TPA: LysR family transcriptional regulator [Candidatus Polarisedimenticolaceae bacterium]|nr:LysR family transcriptional regulator [Candidatus Polarisedimenticolaceae bacterium]
MELDALRAFVTVARLGHVGRAAARLGRTQPSLSARLARLEAAWNTRLFRRHARGMTLTPEGARLLPMAEAVLRGADALEEAAGAPVRGPRELRLGAGDALGRALLPRTIARLRGSDPGLEVRLVEGPGPRLVRALQEAEIDVALVVAGESVPGGLEAAPLLESPVDLLLPPGTAPRSRSLPITFLREKPLVLLQPGSAFRRHVDAVLVREGIGANVAVEVGNLSLVRRFVAAGLGVAPVPAVAFAGESGRGPRVDVRRVLGFPPVRYVWLIRAGAPLATPVRHFLEVLQRGARRPG